MAREMETIQHTIEVEFEESCSFGEEDQMQNPEYTDQVVEQQVLMHHEVERKALETAEHALDYPDEYDDLELMEVYVDGVQRDEDEWTVVVKAVLSYTTEEAVWDDDSDEDRDEDSWSEEDSEDS